MQKKRKDCPPITGKIPIDNVSVLYQGGQYRYLISFAGTSDVPHFVCINTYLVAANGTYSHQFGKSVTNVNPVSQTIDSDHTTPLGPGNYITIAFSDASVPTQPAMKRTIGTSEIDPPIFRRGDPKTGKIPIDGIRIESDPENDGMSRIVLELDPTLGTPDEVIPVYVTVVQNSEHINIPIIEHFPSGFTVPPGPPDEVAYSAASFVREPNTTCYVEAYTLRETAFECRRTRFVIPGMT